MRADPRLSEVGDAAKVAELWAGELQRTLADHVHGSACRTGDVGANGPEFLVRVEGAQVETARGRTGWVKILKVSGF